MSKKETLIFFSFLALIGIIIVLGTTAKAATTGTVTATVTAQNVAVSVSDGTVVYGTITIGDTASTSSDGLDDSQTATNDGNITSDLNIQGQNSANWTLGATSDADQYVHEFCTSNCDSTPTWTALTTSYQTLATGIADAGTQVFDLKIILPSSSSNYTQQSVDITVQIVAQ